MEKWKQNGHLPCFQLNTSSILTCMKKIRQFSWKMPDLLSVLTGGPDCMLPKMYAIVEQRLRWDMNGAFADAACMETED
ncbi:hypothetical protein QH637_12120 [Heyndrickxia coagulans]